MSIRAIARALLRGPVRIRFLASLVVAVVLVAGAGTTAFAETCTFCQNELEPGANPLKCPKCIEIAKKIAEEDEEHVWVLDFKEDKLGRCQIKDDTGDVEVYWFMPYTLTNRSKHVRSFFIDITASSDKTANKEHKYHDMFVPDVFEEISKILGVKEGQQLLTQRELCAPKPGQPNVLPKVQDPRTKETAVISLPEIQPGESLKCVAMFQKFDADMDRLVIKVRGLTNSSLISNDDFVAPENQPHRRVITEAVLLLHYKRPGDEMAHGQDPIEFVGRRWADESRTIGSDLR